MFLNFYFKDDKVESEDEDDFVSTKPGKSRKVEPLSEDQKENTITEQPGNNNLAFIDSDIALTEF